MSMGTDSIYGSSKREILEKEANSLTGSIIFKFLGRPESKKSFISVTESVLEKWAGKSFLKKGIAKRLLKMFSKMLDSMKTEDNSGIAEDVGKLLQLKWMIKGEKSTAEQIQNAEKKADALNRFFNNSDFGEFREMVDKSSEGSTALSKAIVNVIMQHPGKLVAIGAAMPPIINTLLKNINESNIAMQDIAPDFQVNAITGIARLIDGKQIGVYLNNRNESVRKLHTGSLLAGEGNIPAIEGIVSEKLNEVFQVLDPVLLGKWRIGKAENSEAVMNGFLDALMNYPELSKVYLRTYFSQINAGARTLARRLRVFEGLPPTEAAEAFSEGLDKLDTEVIAEIITSLLGVINSVNENKPDIAIRLLSGIATSIDIGKFKKAADSTIMAAAKAVKPVLGVIMPSVVNAWAELLTPEEGEESTELDEAIAKLGALLLKRGGKN